MDVNPIHVVLSLAERKHVIGFGVLAYPEPDGRWVELGPRIMMEVKVIEVCRSWRPVKTALAIVKMLLAHPQIKKIVYLVGYWSEPGRPHNNIVRCSSTFLRAYNMPTKLDGNKPYKFSNLWEVSYLNRVSGDGGIRKIANSLWQNIKIKATVVGIGLRALFPVGREDGYGAKN